MDAGDLWIVITVIGVVILGAALFYGRMKASTTTPREEAMRDAATRAQYENPDPDTATADPVATSDPNNPPRL
jgi:hypothetical protein